MKRDINGIVRVNINKIRKVVESINILHSSLEDEKI